MDVKASLFVTHMSKVKMKCFLCVLQNVENPRRWVVICATNIPACCLTIKYLTKDGEIKKEDFILDAKCC